MAEEWLDCPALGPGWKRREVFRKSGATCGRSDTYYQRYWVGCGQSRVGLSLVRQSEISVVKFMGWAKIMHIQLILII